MTEEECPLTELPVSQCACPKHRGGRTPEEEAIQQARTAARTAWRGPSGKLVARTTSRPFASHFGGQCSECGAWFAEGDMIQYRDGDLVAMDCCGKDP